MPQYMDLAAAKKQAPSADLISDLLKKKQGMPGATPSPVSPMATQGAGKPSNAPSPLDNEPNDNTPSLRSVGSFAPAFQANTNVIPQQPLGLSAPPPAPAPPPPGAAPPPAAPPAAPPQPQVDLSDPVQRDQYWAAKFQQAGVPGMVAGSIPAVGSKVSGAGTVATYDPGVAAQSQAELAAEGMKNPAIAAALSYTGPGAIDSDVAARSAESQKGNDAANEATWDQYRTGLESQVGLTGSDLPEDAPVWWLGTETTPKPVEDNELQIWADQRASAANLPNDLKASERQRAIDAAVIKNGGRALSPEQLAAIDAGQYDAVPGISTDGRYIQGGKEYDNATDAQAAFDAEQQRNLAPKDRAPVSETPPNPATPTVDAPAPQTPTAGPTDTFSEIDPADDLRSKQINPTPSARLNETAGMVDDAARQVGKGKNRGEIAQGYLDAFDERAAPMLRDKIRSVGQRAASLGRLGMGDTAVEALNPYTDYLKERSALESELASRSAEGDITDRLNTLSALRAAEGQEFGQEQSSRGEFRTEREFQNAMAQQAIYNAIRQWQLQQEARNTEFDQGVRLGDFGYNNSPAGLLFGAGGQYGQNANAGFEALARILGPYLFRSQAA